MYGSAIHGSSISLRLSLLMCSPARLITIPQILHAVVAIHEMGLVQDEEVLFIHDGQDTHPLPSTPSVTRKPIQKSAQETSASSLLSAFGSWFAGTADTEDDGPEEHDVVAEAAAKECITAVRLRDLILLSAYDRCICSCVQSLL